MAKQDKEKEKLESKPELSDFDKLIKKALETPKPKKRLDYIPAEEHEYSWAYFKDDPKQYWFDPPISYTDLIEIGHNKDHPLRNQ